MVTGRAGDHAGSNDCSGGNRSIQLSYECFSRKTINIALIAQKSNPNSKKHADSLVFPEKSPIFYKKMLFSRLEKHAEEWHIINANHGKKRPSGRFLCDICVMDV